MDNKCPKTVEQCISSKNIVIQLVPPNNHRVNAAKRAISTFKDHFIAGLCTINPNCPLQLWDEFRPQTQDTLNMLSTSHHDPTKSAYEDLEGPFDFNKKTLSIYGSKSLLLDSTDTRTSWAPHVTDVYDVDTAHKHYRCRRFWDPKTCRIHIGDT